MRFRIVSYLVFASVLVSSPAMAATIATFADPGTNSFTFVDSGPNNDGVGSLTANNADLVVNLPMLGLTFSDASYELTDSLGGSIETINQVDINGLVQATFEGGILSIVTDIAEHGLNMGDEILRATFDSAIGIFGNLFTADELVGNDVVFSGFAINSLPGVTAEQFSFSASNINPGSAVLAPGDIENFTATTSFTSSATPVPVPAAFWLFSTGLAAFIGLGRSRFKTTS